MHIFFNGDSNLKGEELEDRSLSMVNCMVRHFGADHTDLSLSGAGNDYIYDTTMDWLKNNPKPDLVIIGWTDHEREQWWYDGGMHQVNSIRVGMDPMPAQFQERYDYWKDTVKKSMEHWRVMGYYWHNKIFNMHEYLKEAGIPHLFFNTFCTFRYMDPDARTDAWDGCYYDPYELYKSYAFWAMEGGYKEVTPGWWHFEPRAHADWASLMIKHIEENKLYDIVR